MSLLFLSLIFLSIAALFLYLARAVGGLRIALFRGCSGFFLVLASICGYFWWQGRRSVEALAHLISLPKYTDTIYVPAAAEMKAIAGAGAAVPVPNTYPLTRKEAKELATQVGRDVTPDVYWILKTPLAPAEVRAFYQEEKNHKGWEVVEQSDIHFFLRQRNCQLFVLLQRGAGEKETTIVYRLSATEMSPPH